jgi:hypothetical protein
MRGGIYSPAQSRMRTERVVMNRRFLIGILAALAAYPLAGVMAFTRPGMTQRQALPLGRYTCVRAGDSSPLPDLKLVSKDKYENADQTGVYVYEAGSRTIEWLNGSIPKQQVGVYVPKGVDNSKYDTIIIRDKKDVSEGIERDLWRCNLAG